MRVSQFLGLPVPGGPAWPSVGEGWSPAGPPSFPAPLTPVFLLPFTASVNHGAPCGEQVPPGPEDREWVLRRYLPG